MKRELYDKVAFAERLHDWRKDRNLTLAQLSASIEERTGVKISDVTLGKYENEENPQDIRASNLLTLCDYYGVSCDELLRGVKPENIDIHKKTRLGDKAIRNLSHPTTIPASGFEQTEAYSKCVDLLIGSGVFRRFICCLFSYLHVDKQVSGNDIIDDVIGRFEHNRYKSKQEAIDLAEFQMEKQFRALIQSVEVEWGVFEKEKMRHKAPQQSEGD